MSRRRGLGSGLDALIGNATPETQTVRMVSVDRIRENRSQPRTRFDEQALEELAASIREHGVIQPIIVCEDGADNFELIAGERRWRAARKAGLSEIPALVKSSTTPQQLLELALVENVQRSDLNPLEEGQAYQTLRDDFGLSDDEIAKRVGKSRVAVVNMRRLIKLGTPARQALLDNKISAGHGRVLLRFEDADTQAVMLDLILRRELSVRDSERIADIALQTKIAPDVRHALLHGTITLSQAQSLLRIDDVRQQSRVLEVSLSVGLSARETDRFCGLVAEGISIESAFSQVRERKILLGGTLTPTPQREAPRSSPDGVRSAREVEDEDADLPRSTPESRAQDAETRRIFEALLGTPVQIVRSGGTIKLTITLYTDDQLQQIYERLGGEDEL